MLRFVTTESQTATPFMVSWSTFVTGGLLGQSKSKKPVWLFLSQHKYRYGDSPMCLQKRVPQGRTYWVL
jgi:hypothetical protein